MPYFLPKRDANSTEFMDDPRCNRADLFNTYRQFSTVNSMISGWKNIYKSKLKPLFSNSAKTYSLLDIGFGGGDIPLKLARWAGNDGISLNITAIETDPRAMEFIQNRAFPKNVSFTHSSSTKLVERGRQFDAVISNHLIHHLSVSQLKRLLEESEKLSRQLVLFNDIERSDAAYGLFNIFSRPLFRSSFITHDGLASIKRSYTRRELAQHTPKDWQVSRRFPFRLLLYYEHENAQK